MSQQLYPENILLVQTGLLLQPAKYMGNIRNMLIFSLLVNAAIKDPNKEKYHRKEKARFFRFCFCFFLLTLEKHRLCYLLELTHHGNSKKIFTMYVSWRIKIIFLNICFILSHQFVPFVLSL